MAASGQDRLERRLAAILAADVAGYGRLTGADEEGTHVRVQGHLRALVDPKIAEHRGRVVKNTGDGMLAEFSSVVDALRCALDVQHGMAERNAEVPDEKRIEFRIGINVGDIIIDRNVREPIPAAALVGRAPWIAWTGGIFGAIFIATSIFMMPRLGVATVSTLIVVGQLLSSLAFDHIGMFGQPQHPITLARVFGAGCLILGAALVRG